MIERHEDLRWYAGISRYQWFVLLIASLGWVFDAFEGQIFVASMNEAMPSLVPAETPAGRIAFYNNIALGGFLLGGALGGIGFGVLSDRIGRKRTMSWTILCYSVFTCLSAFSQAWWHLAVFRFLVALGVGGEWAVASALVAEEFPKRARAHVASIFHASSVLGVYLAIAVATLLLANPAVMNWALQLEADWLPRFVDRASLPWRLSFALGGVPALLVIWIRRSLREPERWQSARAQAESGSAQRMGAISELVGRDYAGRTCVAVFLAAVGMATFWGAHIYGKDMLRRAVERERRDAVASALNEPPDPRTPSVVSQEETARLKRWEMLGMLLVTTGGGIGLLAFGPISQRIGRRGAFLVFQAGGLMSAIVIFQLLQDVRVLLVALPVFGFLTVGMHAGFAVYFPELYPTRLRGTGAGFCFNAGRILAAPALFAVGWLQDRRGYELHDAATIMSLLFVVGMAALVFAPETRGRELPE